MSTQDNGGSAFPEGGAEWDQDSRRYEMRPLEGGMTLRDYFAAKALGGIDMPLIALNDVPSKYRLIASHCYVMADEMLKARQA